MSQVFDRLLETFYRSWFRFRPDLAVELGVQGYADRLPPVEDSDIGAMISLEQKMLSSLDELDGASLDPDRRLDRDLLRSSLSLGLYEHSRLDWRYHDPVRFLSVEAVEQLMSRPVEHFREALLTRLEQIPDYLRAARSFLLTDPGAVPAFWVDLAIEQAEEGAAYLRGLGDHPKIRQLLARPEHLRAPSEAAGRALVDFRHFLERDLRERAAAAPGCGQEHFERLLRQRHFLDWGADELHRLGQVLASRARALLEAAGPGPTGGPASLADWRAGLERSRERTQRLGIVSLPAGGAPRVAEVPRFLAGLRPLPDYRPPALGAAAEEAILQVTLEEPVAATPAAGVETMCLSCGWPGRHLQALRVNARRASASIPRQLASSSVASLGWGEYCRGLVLGLEQVGESPARWVHAQDRLLAALRLELDVEIHVRGSAAQTAIQRLIDEAGLSPERARAEVAWISRSPAVALGQALGGELLRALCEQQAREGASLREFHDRLLEDGPIPLPLLARRLGGEDSWQSVSAAVRAIE